ncbi:ftsX-like permease family protein [Clostridium argentinense CDC 2741]|uniref:FtsX-like permease family protein n=1 Tax=Clostridium argentinense CDC 2741 TaxID=1418104 RepID=A0A0C1QTJ5_9CLOT|nr:FtsX-like permease family protein [Clostridium argentinense]ARC84315.1 permease [Clostridium argentinense]KIE44307.1 ftsX-like permease family protein [Clostridium argentinense CDC 2741]NFF38278.1 ABC transporter permease [Clostridium argentinense]NFP49137.1 ABC transporter permease [Clostridium argentinense]NFP71583.1 ABC transporter permease [Clostridium argentinense]
MKSYKDITNKYLKHNKKRTVLTICGIILSVALITSIGLFIKSIQNTFIQDAIDGAGSFHIAITNLNNKDYDKIKNNPKIEKVGLKEQWDKVPLKSSKYIELVKIDKNALELLPYKAVEGEIPKADGEIALESWVLNYMDNTPKLGDTIKLQLENGKSEEFKITGLIKNNSYSQLSGASTGVVYCDKFDIEKSRIFATISKKADISDTVEELRGIFKNISTNEDLLRLLGEGENKSINNSLVNIAGLIITIVVIATIAVVYNSFQISVVERIKQFGLLRAVGATPKQIKKIVLREATLISLIGVPLGILCGIFAIWAIAQIFKIMSSSVFGSLDMVISYEILAISAVVGLISIYISALIPAKFAGKISPLIAISSRASITKEKIKKNRGKLVKKLLNINGLMAFKNIKRNKKRFRITVLSMIISVTLFIFFTSFINMTINFTPHKSEDEKNNFEIISLLDANWLLIDGKSTITEDIINKIKNNNEVKELYVDYENYVSRAVISNDKKEKVITEAAPHTYNKTNFNGEEMTSLDILFDIYDDIKLKNTESYITSGKVDKEKMIKENGVILVKNQMFRGKDKYYEVPLTNLKVGDSFYIYKNASIINTKNLKENNEINNFNKDDIIKVKVSAIVDYAPYPIYGNPNHLKIITSKDIMKNISNIDVGKIPYKSAGIILKDEKKEKEFEKWIQPLGDMNGIKVMNTSKEAEETRANNLQINILLYGFVAVVSLIGVVNIINTITTNLILRRKEIASLSALGMTYKNIRSMILTEGILYGVYGSFLGAILGTILSYFMSSSMIGIMGFKWGIPWKTISIAAGASIFIGVIAVIKPLNRIKKENIVEVIRGEQ